MGRPESGRLFRALTNRTSPEIQALLRDVFTEPYVAELRDRYPQVKRTGVVSEGVADQEIARLARELKEIDLEMEA
jgi:hypothetical protein